MCLRPVSVVVQDFFGNRRSIAAPCGKCLECCHNINVFD